MYIYVVNHNFSFIHVANFSSQLVVIQPGARIRFLSGFDKVSAYLAGLEAVELAHTK
jgi:hypothetical protein